MNLLFLGKLFSLIRRRRFRSDCTLRTFGERRFLKGRRGSSLDAYFAGIDAVTGRPVFISEESRMMHMQIVGMTGAAKTEGGIMPALLHDIALGRGALIIDMKGDKELLNRVMAVVTAGRRTDDFLFFSLADPAASNTYNPLLRGNASEIKDKIISSYLWTEEFYKKTSEMVTLKICNAFKALKRPITFRSLLETMNRQGIRKLGEELASKGMGRDLLNLVSVLGRDNGSLAGLLADFTCLTDSDFGKLLSPTEAEIDLLEIYRNNKIVLFQLNTGLYEETAVRFARMLIQDVKTMSNHIQAYWPEAERHFFPIFIDEFASVAYPAFTELISKARSAKIAITIAHQSLGDLQRYGEHFQTQIFENTNLRMVFRQSDPRSVNILTQMAGTVEAEKRTFQTSSMMGEAFETGLGSTRVVEKFRVDPNLVKELPRGYCVLMQKDSNRVCYLQTDFIPVKGVVDFLEKRRKKDEPARETMRQLQNSPVIDDLKEYLETLRVG